MEIPESVGVMILPNAVLFPQALTPLYVFEPRYQEMLHIALESHRLFALGLGSAEGTLRTVGGLGLIRACVHNPDGTSHLVLQGVTRVRFTEPLATEPYLVSRIEALASVQDEVEALPQLGAQVLEAVLRTRTPEEGVPDWLVKYLDELKDFDALADLVSYTFIEDTDTKQQILEELYTTSRLRKVLAALLRKSPLS
jgi:Lon protease-like protein